MATEERPIAGVIDLVLYRRYRSIAAVRWAAEAQPDEPAPVPTCPAIPGEPTKAIERDTMRYRHLLRPQPSPRTGDLMSFCGGLQEGRRGFTNSPARLTCPKCIRNLAAAICAARAAGAPAPFDPAIEEVVLAKERRRRAREARRWEEARRAAWRESR